VRTEHKESGQHARNYSLCAICAAGLGKLLQKVDVQIEKQRVPADECVGVSEKIAPIALEQEELLLLLLLRQSNSKGEVGHITTAAQHTSCKCTA